MYLDLLTFSDLYQLFLVFASHLGVQRDHWSSVYWFQGRLDRLMPHWTIIEVSPELIPTLI